jgi:hypothetical protein
VADELTRALRNEERWSQDCSCNREPQFHELYRHLGNKAKQDEIRARSEGRPCFILMRDPAAKSCNCLPKDIGIAKAGEPCPNNPYHRNADLYDELVGASSVIEMARYYETLSEIGGIDADSVLPEEWVLIRTMLAEKRREQYKVMQTGMMQMFGGTKSQDN